MSVARRQAAVRTGAAPLADALRAGCQIGQLRANGRAYCEGGSKRPLSFLGVEPPSPGSLEGGAPYEDTVQAQVLDGQLKLAAIDWNKVSDGRAEHLIEAIWEKFEFSDACVIELAIINDNKAKELLVRKILYLNPQLLSYINAQTKAHYSISLNDSTWYGLPTNYVPIELTFKNDATKEVIHEMLQHKQTAKQKWGDWDCIDLKALLHDDHPGKSYKMKCDFIRLVVLYEGDFLFDYLCFCADIKGVDLCPLAEWLAQLGELGAGCIKRWSLGCNKHGLLQMYARNQHTPWVRYGPYNDEGRIRDVRAEVLQTPLYRRVFSPDWWSSAFA